MIIFLYGPDSYRLANYARELQSRYRAKYQSGLNLVTCDASVDTTIPDLTDSLKSTSFFDEVKLIVIKNPFSHKPAANALVSLLHDQDAIARKDIVVLLYDARGGKDLKASNKELFELATQKGNTVQEFEYLSGSILNAWIKKEAERQQCTLDAAAISILIQRIGADTWNLSQEITKLANYRGSATVSREDVIKLTASSEDLSIFDLVDAFAARNKPKSYTLMYQELQSGRDPYYILTMLTYQVRNLLMVSDLLVQKLSPSEIAKRAGLHPFVVRKTIEQSRKFSGDELHKLYETLVDMEYQTKQGTINLQDNLYLLLH